MRLNKTQVIDKRDKQTDIYTKCTKYPIDDAGRFCLLQYKWYCKSAIRFVVI